MLFVYLLIQNLKSRENVVYNFFPNKTSKSGKNENCYWKCLNL